MSQPPLLFSGTAEELLQSYRQAVPAASTTAPRSAPSSPARLSRVIEAVREHNSKVPDLSKPRKRIGFRAHVVAGPL